MNNIPYTGIDMIEIDRIENSINRNGETFLKRVFTKQEIEDCMGRVESLAARFAAKEATVKALGCGIGKVTWQDIEIINNPDGQPEVNLYNTAKEIANKLNLGTWSISLSHTKQLAIAMFVAIGKN